jgi:SAM-dependent methyltransferase
MSTPRTPLDRLEAEMRAVKEHLAALRSQRKMCPVCLANFEEYAPYGTRKRARCPACSASERHRLSWLFMKARTDLFKQPTRFLHFAPEPIFQRQLELYLTIDYTTASYDPDKPDEGVDLQNLPYADNSFDMFYCSHVLEHVPDDRKAMRELGRVLRPDGLGIIMVPARNEPTTYEDSTITTPEGRLKAFGKLDHLRWYGRDFPDRLGEQGFDVEVAYCHDHFSLEEQSRYGLRAEPIYVCRRP